VNAMEERLEALTRVASDAEKRWGTDHLETLRSKTVLGTALREEKRLEESQALLERVVGEAQRTLGPRTLETAEMARELGNTYFALGEYSKAKEVQQARGHVLIHDFPKERAAILEAHGDLANTLFALGEFEDLVELQTLIVRVNEVTFGLESPEAIAALQRLVILYFACLMDFPIATELSVELLRRARIYLGFKSNQLGRFEVLLSICLLANKELSKAQQVLIEATADPERLTLNGDLRGAIGLVQHLIDASVREPERFLFEFFPDSSAISVSEYVQEMFL